ncbi:MAG: hypothetical protein WDA16_09000 [Candidatus Thermoplasmatota archaeon]
MRRNLALALALSAVALAPLLSGCVTVGGDPLIIALSAPKAASGMTLFLVTQQGFVSRLADVSPNAEYAIYYGDRLVYPPGGHGAGFRVDGRAGSAFIPYDRFVVGNGDYDVLVTYSGIQTRARVTVEKWVNYVFLHPFDKGNTIVVEAALASATGGAPENRVLASGDLVLTLHYRGRDGADDRIIGSVVGQTQNDEISTAVPIPTSRFTQGPGYYSIEPRFHNLEAIDNVQVTGDPTMANHVPPWNWIYVSQ